VEGEAPWLLPSIPDPPPRTSSSSWQTTANRSYLLELCVEVRSRLQMEVFSEIVESLLIDPPSPSARMSGVGILTFDPPLTGLVLPEAMFASAVVSLAEVEWLTRAAR